MATQFGAPVKASITPLSAHLTLERLGAFDIRDVVAEQDA
jgi:hypothetical protein